MLVEGHPQRHTEPVPKELTDLTTLLSNSNPPLVPHCSPEMVQSLDHDRDKLQNFPHPPPPPGRESGPHLSSPSFWPPQGALSFLVCFQGRAGTRSREKGPGRALAGSFWAVLIAGSVKWGE